MIQRCMTLCLQQPVLVLFIAILIGLMGVRAIYLTPIDAIPDLTDVQVIVKTSYPGQSPDIVEQQITRPLSSALMAVPGAHTVRGFSYYGDSYIYLIFNQNTDIYWARSRVLEYLNQATAQLPKKAQTQLGPDASGVGWVYAYALQDPSNQYDLAQLRSLQDWFIKYELQTVPGVAEIAPVGGIVKQYEITVDPQKLRYYGLPLMHINTALQHHQNEQGIGAIEMGETEYMVRATGAIKNAAMLLDIPLGMSVNGVPLLLRQVADINEVPAMRRGIAELNGLGEVVGGIVVMRSGENANNTVQAVKQKLQQIKSALPKGVEIMPVYDRTQLIHRAVHHLVITLVQELVIVGLLLLLFIASLRSVMVAMITLPMGILISFVIMQWQGLNANIMSLGGIAIAIGTMVDGAIVMIENLHRNRREHPDFPHLKLVQYSVAEVGPTLFFSLLVITLSFIPVFTLEAEEGRLFAPLAYTKTYAMAAAAVITVTLMPVLLYYFVFPDLKDTQTQWQQVWQLKWQAAYQRSLKWSFQHFKIIGLGCTLVFISALLALTQIATEFMPPLDEGDIMYMPTTYPGISIGKAREVLQQTDKIIRTQPEVASVFGKVGRAETATDPAPLTMIETFIQLKPKSEWRKGMTTQKIMQELDHKIRFPGLTNAWVMPIKTRMDMLTTGLKTALGIKLAGPDAQVLESLGEQIETLLKTLPATKMAYAERNLGGQYITLNINRVAAALYGFTQQDVQEWLQMSVGAMPVAETLEGVERYPISLRFPDAYRATPEAIQNLPLISDKGHQLKLGDIAEVRMETGPHMLKSENGRLNTWLYLDIGDMNSQTYIEEAESLIQAKVPLPVGYSLRWAGEFESIQRVKKSLQWIIPFTLGLIILMLYLNFRRLFDVSVLVGTLPLALLGGVWMVWWLDYKWSVAVGVGFIALAGIAIETGAIMLQILRNHTDQSVNTLSEWQGAVVGSAAQRLRPVMMTASSTLLGLCPVMWGTEPGAEVMSRIAAPVIGGLITSVFLTLYIVPMIYAWRYHPPVTKR